MIFTACIALGLLPFSIPVGAQVISAQDVLSDKPVPRSNFLTRPCIDKPGAVLAEINAGAAIWDDVASRRVLDDRGYERNPLLRPFVHHSGTLAAETVGEMWLPAFVADRMKRSHHAVPRKTWWLPRTLNISAKLCGGINSTVLLGP